MQDDVGGLFYIFGANLNCMLRYSYLLIFSMILSSASAQLRPNESDGIIYDLTYDLLLETPDGTEQGFSNGHSFSFMDNLPLGGDNVSFAYGIGFSSHNYHTSISASINGLDGSGVYADTSGYESNKLTVQYIDVPLELRFRSTPNRKGNFFRFYVGGKFGVRVNAYSKFKNGNTNVRFYHFDELNRYRYGVYTRIGYSNISLYGYYGLSQLFEEGQTIQGGDLTKMIPLSIGISISI